MSVTKFSLRLLALIVVISGLGAVAIEVVFYQVMTPTWADLKLMALVPLPQSIAVTTAYLLAAFALAGRIIRFLLRINRGEAVPDAEVRAVQERCLNLPYYLGAMSVPAFFLGATLIARSSLLSLGWPVIAVWYGALTGLICGLLALPLYIYQGYYVTAPVLELTLARYPGLGIARRAGFQITTRRKLIAVVSLLVAASAGYAALVGYSQTNAVLKNMERMEAELRAAAPAVKLLSEQDVAHATDPGIRSTAYYRSRLGRLEIFYFSLLAVALLVSVLIANSAARGLTRPIRALMAAAEQVSRGDYERPVRLLSNDELADLAATMNRMMATIRDQIQASVDLIEDLRQGIMEMDQTSTTVLSISSEQAAGATEQASAVAETSTIAAEIVATARQISERARGVETVATDTLTACREGEGRLAEALSGFEEIYGQSQAIVTAMDALEDRFAETFKIAEWMDEIADQTQLLALNAELEAAGAGAEGRRFAVVAEATRRLAARAAEATGQIRGLIRAIQDATNQAMTFARQGKDKVDAGGGAVTATGFALTNISSFAATTSTAVREISRSTEQQTAASEQLAAAVKEVAEVAQRVEAGAMEIQAAISRLADFSDSLRKMVEAKDQ
jgi:methyl-accepting chemotaxis protein